MADLWEVVWGKPQVDPHALADAVGRAALGEPALDYRTRLLIRDSVRALQRRWGPEGLERWLRRLPARDAVERICREAFAEVGFPLLQEVLVDRTDPETVRQFFRELGVRLHRPARLVVGGSIALILPGLLQRATQDIGVVDEVPEEIRREHALLDELSRSYGLQLTHFQSRFLPAGWDARVQTLKPFGQLQAALVGPLDVFLSKLFSGRRKDLDDLRVLLPGLDRAAVLRRLGESCAALLGDPALRRQAEQNGYVLTGGALP